MSDEPDTGEVGHLRELFRSSFPNVGCLRCGNGEFYILPATREGFWTELSSRPTFLNVVTLACTRCGHIERHLTDQLEKASKPIEITKDVAS
jgi:predicted nucleic-acid-binding Zn-ribbon protein